MQIFPTFFPLLPSCVDQIKYRGREILKEPPRIFRGVPDAWSRSISTVPRGGSTDREENRLGMVRENGIAETDAFRSEKKVRSRYLTRGTTLPFRDTETFQLSSQIAFINFNGERPPSVTHSQETSRYITSRKKACILKPDTCLYIPSARRNSAYVQT